MSQLVQIPADRGGHIGFKLLWNDEYDVDIIGLALPLFLFFFYIEISGIVLIGKHEICFACLCFRLSRSSF